MEGNSHKYRPDIDGLRAIAVIAVVVFHAFPKVMAGGFAGVDIFFVISGLLISGIIIDGLERGTFRFADFYQRRIRRIFPALTIVLATFLVLGWFFLLPDEYRDLGKHTVAGAGFASNLALLRESVASYAQNGYFAADSTRKPLLHLWSLGIEEQFYLFWPLCLVLLWKVTKKRLWAILSLAVVSFVLNLWLLAHPSMSFYLPFTRFWELLLGCIIGLIGRHGTLPAHLRPETNAAIANACAIAGALLIVTGFFVLNNDRNFPGWWALVPASGAALLIFAGPGSWINRSILSTPWLVFVGLISYPLYLWHWPLFSFSRILGIATTRTTLVLIVVSVILAWATWKYVEIGTRKGRGWTYVPVWGISLGTIGLAGSLAFGGIGLPGRPLLTGTPTGENTGSVFPTIHCSIGPRKFNLCSQSKAGTPQAVVVGDSHAGVLGVGLAAADTKRTWLVTADLGCPPLLGVTVDNPAVGLHCAEPVKSIFDYLSRPDSPDLVVLAFYGYYAETSDYSESRLQKAFAPSNYRLESNPPLKSKQEAFALGLSNTVEFLLSRNKRVVLSIDVPELPFLPADCLKRWFIQPANCHLDRAAVTQRQAKLRMVVAQLQHKFPQLIVFDPYPVLCDEKGCDPMQGNVPLYEDSDHLSFVGGRRVGAALAAMIDSLPEQDSNRTLAKR